MVDVSETLGTITEYAHRLDHNIVEEFHPTENGQMVFHGYKLRHPNGRNYDVLISRSTDYAHIVMNSDLTRYVANQMSEEERNQYLNAPLADQVDIEDNHLRAARTRIEIEHQKELNELESGVRDALESESCVENILRTNMGTFIGFEATRRVFPEEPDFTLTHYNDSVRSVALAGSRAIRYLSENLELFDQDVDPSEYETPDSGEHLRSFQ